MAIVANTFNIQELPNEGSEFHVSLQSEGVNAGEILVAAVALKSHFLTDLTIRSDAAMDIVVGSGTTAQTVHIGPVPVSPEAGIFGWKAPRGKGLRFTSGLPIAINSTAAGTIWIEAHGKTCKDNLNL